MKRIFKFFLCVMLLCSVSLSFCGCGKKNKNSLLIYMPDGAPALAMSKLMYENEQFDCETSYHVVSSSNIANFVIQKNADLAIIPINMATKILSDGENYKIISSVTNGNLFIVGNQKINGLKDLKNQVIGVIGQGNVPDLNFRYLLNAEEIEYESSENVVPEKVAIRYFSDASSLIPMLKTGKLKFGLLPEPAVSKLLSIANNFNVELNIQQLWGNESYPQAVLIANSKIYGNQNLLDKIITKLKENQDWILEQPVNAVEAINNHLDEGVVASLQTTISVGTIRNCNIKVIPTTEIGEIERMKSYLQKIKSVNNLAVGSYTDNLFWCV